MSVVRLALHALVQGAVLSALGCGESIQQHDTLGAHPGTLLVLDTLRAPAPGVDVLVNGTALTTDENGEAPLPTELPATYDIAATSGSDVLAYIGMTTHSPTVYLPNLYLSSDIAGADLQVPYPPDLGENQDMLVTFGVRGAGVKERTYGTNGNDAGLYAEATWAGPPSATASAEAFLVARDPDTGEVSSYLGYANREWADAGGLSATWVPEFGPVPFELASIELDVDVPEGSSIDFSTASVTDASGRYGYMGTSYVSPARFLVPSVAGASYDVRTLTSDGEGHFVAGARDVAPGTGVQLQPLNGPTAIAPEDQATGVTSDTEFVFDARDGAIYCLYAYTTDDGPYLHYEIATPTPAAKVPDLSSLGMPFPRGRSFSWSAHTVYGLPSLDSYAAGDGSTGSGYSDRRSFTTLP